MSNPENGVSNPENGVTTPENGVATHPHIALVMMVKNEHKRLQVSLDSVRGYIDSLIFYDTGSEDDTIEIITRFAEANNLPLHLIQGEFVDFSTSRNILMDYADTFEEVDYQLLLDCNDELRGGDKLLEIVKKIPDTQSCWAISQQWLSGNALETYIGLRLVRPRTGWRYKGVIHEGLNNEGQYDAVAKLPMEINLYQNRNDDDDKSAKRHLRDVEILFDLCEKDPTDSRSIFYLAKTYMCLSRLEEAYYYFKLRASFPITCQLDSEEIFYSYIKLGDIATVFKHPWEEEMKWYMKALELSGRAEPAVTIAKHYIKTQNWQLAFTFAHLACSFGPYPNAMLWVKKQDYDYERWHLLGITGFYVNRFDEGRKGCEMAIKAGVDVEQDTANLGYYDTKVILDP